jgi:hypothetical protein
MHSQRSVAATLAAAAAGVLALLCLAGPAAAGTAGLAARAGGALLLSPDHGLPGAQFTAAYKLINDTSCALLANRNVNFFWDSTATKLGSATLDNTCVATLTTQPPKGFRQLGQHTVLAEHGLISATLATATYTIEPPPTPTTTEPSPTPTPSYSQGPSPTPTARPSTTRPTTTDPGVTDTATVDLGPPPSTTLVAPTLPPDDSTDVAGQAASGPADSASGPMLVAFMIGGILMASGGAALVLLRYLNNRRGAE